MNLSSVLHWVSDSPMFWLQENLILMKETVNKCSTDQRFIFKEITSYKIHTLVGSEGFTIWVLSTSFQKSNSAKQVFSRDIIHLFSCF